MAYKLLNTLLLLIIPFSFFFSCKKESVIFQENFENNSNQWDTLSNIYMSNKINENNFIMDNRLDNILNYSLINLDFFNENKKISFSSSIRFEKFYNTNGISGLILYADDKNNPKNYILFGVNAQNEIIISEESISANLARTYYKQINKAYKVGQLNTFSFLVSEGNIQFLINNNPIIVIKKNIYNKTYFGFITLNSKLISNKIVIK